MQLYRHIGQQPCSWPHRLNFSSTSLLAFFSHHSHSFQQLAPPQPAVPQGSACCAVLQALAVLRPSLAWIVPFQELFSRSFASNVFFPMPPEFSSLVSAKYVLHISCISIFVSCASSSSSCLNFLFISPTPHNYWYFLMMFGQCCHVLLILKF